MTDDTTSSTHEPDAQAPDAQAPDAQAPGTQAPDIRWNDEARAKILDDADGVLRDAVLSTARSYQSGGEGSDSDEVYAELNSKLKDRFIDYEPGPDVRKYADAIVAGEFSSH